MIRSILAAAAVVMGLTAAAMAGAKEDVQAAAKKLGEAENYSWTSSVEGGFASKTEGKVQKDGLTVLKMTFGDNSTELVTKAGKGAIKTQDGWMSLADATGDNAPQGPGRFIARMAQNFRTPAKQAEEAASAAKELSKTDDAYSGELTEQGVKDLMAFGRRGGNAPEVKNAKGTVKFWVKDGILTKTQIHVQGTINFNNEDRDLDRTTTVEIKDVGTTKVEIPEEAKSKMDK
jgi:hypothetical protein